MTESPHEPGHNRWPLLLGVTAVLLVLLLLIFGGNPERPDDQAQQPGAGATTQTPEEQCRRQLAGILDGLRPERLGVSVGVEAMVDDLNIWWTDCGAKSQASVAAPADEVRQLLGDQAAARAAAGTFDARDAGHIRLSLLCRVIADKLKAAFPTDVDRAVAAFDFVVRQVALVADERTSPPLTPFEILLFGRGTAEDRAWSVAVILRALDLEAVVIRPHDESGTPPAGPPWLIGVIVPNAGVYLFDPAAGLPIPAREQDVHAVLLTRPATLADVRADDALLRQLDVPEGAAYPLTAERLQRVKVDVIGDSCVWSGRMAAVQEALPREYAATLSASVTESESSPGVLQRVRDAGRNGLWSADSVTAWDYPETRTVAFYAAGGDTAEILRQQFSILGSHRVSRRRLDGKGGEVLVETETDRPLRFVRTQHLMQQFTEAIVGYGAVRLLSKDDAAQADASYWIGLCQYEMGEYAAAVDNLQLYLRASPVGTWRAAARYVQALCEAEQGRPAQAAAVLSAGAAEGSRLGFGDAYLIRRWRSLAGASAAEGSPGQH